MSRTRFLIFIVFSCVIYPLVVFCQLIFRRSGIEGFKRILIIPQTNRIGDIVCATPVIELINRFDESIGIDVLVSKQKNSWEVLKNNPLLRKIVFYENENLIYKLYKEKYDVCFNLTNNPLPSVITFLALIPRRVKTLSESPSLSERLTDYLNTSLFLYKHHTNLPNHYIKMISELGIPNNYIRPSIYLGKEGEQKFLNFKVSVLNNEKFIIMSVTAGNKIKELPPRKFAEIVNGIMKDYSFHIVFVGSRFDEKAIYEVISLIKNKERLHVVTDCNVEDLPSFISRAECLIGADTGPIYIAYALGVPTIDIVGPVDVYEQPPRGEMHMVVLPHSPSFPTSFVMKRADVEKFHNQAIELTSSEDVLDAFKILMSRKRNKK